MVQFQYIYIFLSFRTPFVYRHETHSIYSKTTNNSVIKKKKLVEFNNFTIGRYFLSIPTVSFIYNGRLHKHVFLYEPSQVLQLTMS